MYGIKNKINRSNSESDLNITNFDNLSVSSPRDSSIEFSKNLFSPIVRRVYIEEIISTDKNHFSKMSRSYSELLSKFFNTVSIL